MAKKPEEEGEQEQESERQNVVKISMGPLARCAVALIQDVAVFIALILVMMSLYLVMQFMAVTPALHRFETNFGHMVPPFDQFSTQDDYSLLVHTYHPTFTYFIQSDPESPLRFSVAQKDGSYDVVGSTINTSENAFPPIQTINISLAAGLWKKQYRLNVRPVELVVKSIMIRGMVGTEDFTQCVHWGSVTDSVVSLPPNASNLTFELSTTEYAVARLYHEDEYRPSDIITTTFRALAEDCNEDCVIKAGHRCTEGCDANILCSFSRFNSRGCFMTHMPARCTDHHMASHLSSQVQDKEVAAFLSQGRLSASLCFDGGLKCSQAKGVDSDGRLLFQGIDPLLVWHNNHSNGQISLKRYDPQELEKPMMYEKAILLAQGAPPIIMMLAKLSISEGNAAATTKGSREAGDVSIEVLLDEWDVESVTGPVLLYLAPIILDVSFAIEARGYDEGTQVKHIKMDEIVSTLEDRLLQEAKNTGQTQGGAPENIFVLRIDGTNVRGERTRTRTAANRAEQRNTTDYSSKVEGTSSPNRTSVLPHFETCTHVSALRRFAVCDEWGDKRRSFMVVVPLDPWKPETSFHVMVLPKKGMVGFQPMSVPVFVKINKAEEPLQWLIRKQCGRDPTWLSLPALSNKSLITCKVMGEVAQHCDSDGAAIMVKEFLYKLSMPKKSTQLQHAAEVMHMGADEDNTNQRAVQILISLSRNPGFTSMLNRINSTGDFSFTQFASLGQLSLAHAGSNLTQLVCDEISDKDFILAHLKLIDRGLDGGQAVFDCGTSKGITNLLKLAIKICCKACIPRIFSVAARNQRSFEEFKLIALTYVQSQDQPSYYQEHLGRMQKLFTDCTASAWAVINMKVPYVNEELKAMYLTGNELTKDGLGLMVEAGPHHAVQTIDLSGNTKLLASEMVCASLAELVAECPELRSLDLSRSGMTGSCLKEMLDFNGTHGGVFGGKIENMSLSDNVNLFADFGGHTDSGKYFSLLVSSFKNSLRSFDLGNVGLTPREFHHIVTGAPYPKIMSIDLHQNKMVLSRKGCGKMLDDLLGHCPNLQSLHIESTGFKMKALKEMARSTNFSYDKLTHIYVGGNPTLLQKPEGGIYLANLLKKYPSIQHLDISGTDACAGSLSAFAKAGPFPTLTLIKVKERHAAFGGSRSGIIGELQPALAPNAAIDVVLTRSFREHLRVAPKALSLARHMRRSKDNPA
jgi:hypothetical protein